MIHIASGIGQGRIRHGQVGSLVAGRGHEQAHARSVGAAEAQGFKDYAPGTQDTPPVCGHESPT